MEQQIRDSLLAFMTNRSLKPDESLTHTKITGTVCRDEVACVLVAAILPGTILGIRKQPLRAAFNAQTRPESRTAS